MIEQKMPRDDSRAKEQRAEVVRGIKAGLTEISPDASARRIVKCERSQ
jgi:hypothetical protein